MAEPIRHEFNHKELVTALIKHKAISEGLWMLTVQFGLAATNVENKKNGKRTDPAAIVPLLSVGITRTNTMNDLAVDAAEIYAAQPSKPRTAKAARASKPK